MPDTFHEFGLLNFYCLFLKVWSR